MWSTVLRIPCSVILNERLSGFLVHPVSLTFLTGQTYSLDGLLKVGVGLTHSPVFVFLGSVCALQHPTGCVNSRGEDHRGAEQSGFYCWARGAPHHEGPLWVKLGKPLASTFQICNNFPYYLRKIVHEEVLMLIHQLHARWFARQSSWTVHLIFVWIPSLLSCSSCQTTMMPGNCCVVSVETSTHYEETSP